MENKKIEKEILKEIKLKSKKEKFSKFKIPIFNFLSFLKSLKNQQEILKLFILFFLNESKKENPNKKKIKLIYSNLRNSFQIIIKENKKNQFLKFKIFSIFSSIVKLNEIFFSFFFKKFFKSSPSIKEEEEEKILKIKFLSLIFGSTLSSIPITNLILNKNENEKDTDIGIRIESNSLKMIKNISLILTLNSFFGIFLIYFSQFYLVEEILKFLKKKWYFSFFKQKFINLKTFNLLESSLFFSFFIFSNFFLKIKKNENIYSNFILILDKLILEQKSKL